LRGALEFLETSGEIRRTMGRLGGIVVNDGKIIRHLNTIQGVPDMLGTPAALSDR
jgi:GntR family transcriptional regulator